MFPVNGRVFFCLSADLPTWKRRGFGVDVDVFTTNWRTQPTITNMTQLNAWARIRCVLRSYRCCTHHALVPTCSVVLVVYLACVLVSPVYRPLTTVRLTGHVAEWSRGDIAVEYGFSNMRAGGREEKGSAQPGGEDVMMTR